MVKDRKSECLEDLRMRILTLDAAPGSDLDEASLCKEYGLSRTPMREIFQRLSGEGYIQLAQNRGAKVASMDLPVMRMFFQTAPVVYANVARLAAENRREAEIPALQLIQNE
ncbi:MAG: GntR family transcriptional regulator, partial [Pseudomonadota bacterium]